MGLKDRVASAAGAAAEVVSERREAAAERHAGFEYDTDVNKGSVNMRSFASMLNERAAKGWRLHTAFEQDGNTVCIFERAK